MPIQAPLSPLEKTLSQATLESSQNAQSVESLESTFSKADSMDCHATAAAVSRNDSISNAYTSPTHNDSISSLSSSLRSPLGLKQSTKPTRLSLSLALVCVLYAQASASNGQASLQHCYQSCTYYDLASYSLGGIIELDNSTPNSNTTYTLGSGNNPRFDFRLENNHTAGNVTFKMVDNHSKNLWTSLKPYGGSRFEGRDGTIKSFTLKNQTRFETNLPGTTTINTLNNQAKRVNLRVNGDSGRIIIGTLNQDNGNISNGGSSSSSSTNSGDTQIFKGATVNNFNLQSGKAYQFDGTVGNLTITGGEYYQGIMDNNNVVPDTNSSNANNIGTGGTIKNLILAGGTFKYYKGQVENITLVAPQAAQAATQASVSSTQSSDSNQGGDSSTPSLFGKGSPTMAMAHPTQTPTTA